MPSEKPTKRSLDDGCERVAAARPSPLPVTASCVTATLPSRAAATRDPHRCEWVAAARLRFRPPPPPPRPWLLRLRRGDEIDTWLGDGYWRGARFRAVDGEAVSVHTPHDEQERSVAADDVRPAWQWARGGWSYPLAGEVRSLAAWARELTADVP